MTDQHVAPQYVYKLTAVAKRDDSGTDSNITSKVTVIAKDFEDAKTAARKLVAPLNYGYYWHFRADEISPHEDKTTTYPLIIDKDFRE